MSRKQAVSGWGHSSLRQGPHRQETGRKPQGGQRECQSIPESQSASRKRNTWPPGNGNALIRPPGDTGGTATCSPLSASSARRSRCPHHHHSPRPASLSVCVSVPSRCGGCHLLLEMCHQAKVRALARLKSHPQRPASPSNVAELVPSIFSLKLSLTGSFFTASAASLGVCPAG